MWNCLFHSNWLQLEEVEIVSGSEERAHDCMLQLVFITILKCIVVSGSIFTCLFYALDNAFFKALILPIKLKSNNKDNNSSGVGVAVLVCCNKEELCGTLMMGKFLFWQYGFMA